MTSNSGHSQTWRLPRDPASASAARRQVELICDDFPPPKVEIARLLVTELVTNAIRHGTGEIVLVVSRHRTGLRVELHDENPEHPRVVETAPTPDGGMGMRLVDEMADTWGVIDHDHGRRRGKAVWFTLTYPPR